jgi:formylglycine-generating enzyme required for sulfatase activity
MPTKPTNPEKKSTGWTDREILGLDQDRLKFEHYASVLAEIIQEADTPLTVGIFGSWGSGKTSLMRLIKDTLDKHDNKTQYKTLWFDAWTFDKEDALWRAVILLVLTKIREELSAEEKELEKEKDKEATKKKQALEAAKKKLSDLESSLYRDVDRQETGGVTIDWPKAGVTAASGLARLSLSLVPGVGSLLADAVDKATEKVSGEKLDSLFDAVQRKRQEIHREHIASLEQFQIGFAELLKEHFLKKDRRLVVFIDDLDRCLPEKAISVLEAIKLFLDAPGCVYVVGTDRDVIEQGIRVKYKDFFVGETTKTPITGDSYLEKIIQIPFHMPPLQEKRIDDFIAQFDQSVSDDCRKILAAGIEPNPRKVKRTINVFRLLRKLAEKRVGEKEIDEFNAGLLAKIVVIQSRWRELYNDLQEYPNLIQDLERNFHKPEIEPLPLAETKPTNAGLLTRFIAATALPASAPRQEGNTDKEEAIQGSKTPTLLDKYTAIKSLENMLRLPPFFESLKIDQIQLYLYMTHTVVAEPETKEEPFNVDQRRWVDLLSNDPTKVRAAAEAIQADQQAKSYAPSLLNVISGKQPFPTSQRVSAGNALGYLGDPRFREDAWYLPDDPMLGFIEIPAGKFLMGSDPAKDAMAEWEEWEAERPQHEVTLPTYLIARYPITVAQFQSFVMAKPYQPQTERSLSGLPNHPSANVTWHEALAYCEWLSNTLKAWKDIPQTLAEKLAANQWRITLPSEAEWEKAARHLPSPSQGEGSGMRVYPWGNDFDLNKANVEMKIGTTSAVGCFPNGASPYGLLDMSGNVWEWTRSLWGKTEKTPDFKYPYDPKDGRENLKAPNDVRRAVRGGSCLDLHRLARCASRSGGIPDYSAGHLGFRVVSPGS